MSMTLYTFLRFKRRNHHMKYMLTIESGDAAALSRILASIGGVAVTMSQLGVSDDDADDNAPVNTAAPAVDGNGLPWDERIHSSNKQLTAKGVWRARKNVQPAEVTRVEAELRQRAATAAAPPPAMPMPAAYPAVPASPPAIPQPAPTPAPVPQPAPAAGMGFGEFMAKYTNAVNTGICTPAGLQGYLSASGVATLGDLSSDPAMTLKIHDWMAGNGKL